MIKRIRKTIDWLTKTFEEDETTTDMKTTDCLLSQGFYTPFKE